MFKRLAILRLVHVGSIKANPTQFCRVDGRYIYSIAAFRFQVQPESGALSLSLSLLNCRTANQELHKAPCRRYRAII